MPLNLAVLMILFCKNDKRPMGCLVRVLLYHVEFEKKNQVGQLQR